MRVPLALIVVAAAALAVALPFGATRADETVHVVGGDPVSVGRFLVNYGGCNDCHTPQWNELHERISEGQRLTGNPQGFTGPWGTSYAANLRLLFANLTEAQWLALVRKPAGVDHPPMPWWNVQMLSPGEQRAIYAYIHGLGTAGQPAPAYQPPVNR